LMVTQKTQTTNALRANVLFIWELTRGPLSIKPSNAEPYNRVILR
jgi:hypothetical protein